jgi:hypothetical protein
LRQFRVRGLKKVRCEALWACLAYNLLQWVRLRWKVRLAEAKNGGSKPPGAQGPGGN